MNATLPTSAPFHQKLPPASLMRALVSPKPQPFIPFREERLSTGHVQFAFDFDHQSALLFVNEVAEELRYSDDHVQRLILSGDLCAFTINASEGSMVLRPAYRILRADAVRARARFPKANADARIAEIQDYIATADTWLYPTAKKTLTVAETAALLRCSARHVRVLHKHGNFGHDLGPATQLSLRIPRAELTAFVQRRLKLTNNL